MLPVSITLIFLALPTSLAVPTVNLQARDDLDGIDAKYHSTIWPPYDPDNPNPNNYYPTRLFGFDFGGSAAIKKAYIDANRIVNIDGVKSNINWESAAALEFLGPSALNKKQQKQIQAVFANVATVKDGWTFLPNYIHIRCDDPLGFCPEQCGNADTQSDGEEIPEKPRVLSAHSRNPEYTADGYSMISICLPFFLNPTLDMKVSQGAAQSDPSKRFDLTKYQESRGEIILHELFHLDLAADSVKESPNPRIHDLEVRFYYHTIDKKTGQRKYLLTSFMKAYGPALAKVLARFIPISGNFKQTGEFVQRNVDNLVYFALANYASQILGGYPFLPRVNAEPYGQPMSPTMVDSPYIHFTQDNDNVTIFELFDYARNRDSIKIDSPDDCIPPANAEADSDAGDFMLEIGAPAADDLYPKSYWDAVAEFTKFIADNELRADTCKLAIKEIWTCEDVSENLYASMEFTSAGDTVVYQTPGSTRTPGVPINNNKPFTVKEAGMKHELKVVGEHKGDYMHFWYGDVDWTTTSSGGEASCKLRSDDWDKSGPKGCPNAAAISRTFDCQFPC